MEGELKKLVIVDDDVSYLSIVRNLLKSYFEVYPAPSAIKLFTIMGNFIPDMVLLDLDMPGMNGFQVIKAMKENPRYKDVPIMLLTAMEDESSLMEGLNLGATDYVTKPFTGPLLVLRINNILQIEQQKREILTLQATVNELRNQNR